MKLVIGVLTVILAVFVPTNGIASDCRGKVLFEDNFTKADPAWILDPEATVDNGKLTVKLLAEKSSRSLYQGDVFPDGTEICATFRLVSASELSDAKDLHYAGLIFWAKDYQSNHALWVSEVGKFSVLRWLTNDRLLTPIPWQDSAAINKGIGQVNSLRVSMKGTTAIIYINGKEVGKVSGQTPEGGNEIGFWVGCAAKSGCTWEVSNFVVSLPQ